jgi:hypothetical protein
MVKKNLSTEVSKITIFYIDSAEEEDDTLAGTLFSQRCSEQEHFLEILPPSNTFTRMPFAMLFTSTNFSRAIMVCSFNLSQCFLFVVSMHNVVGMTIWVGQGQSNMPADVPGITATPGRGGRLRPKSWLRQQPVEIFSIEGPSH